MTNGVAWTRAKAPAFFAGALVTLTVAVVTGLFALGGERRAVLDHLASTEPLRSEAAIHLRDREAHLSDAEAQIFASLPAKFNEIDYRLARIESEMRETRRIADEVLRRTK